MFTRDQLLEDLSKLPGNPPLIQASDAEGNEFSEFAGYSIEYINEDFDNDYELSVFNEDDIRDDNDGEIPDNFKQVVVFWRV
ncbi:hypothetical protein SEA_ATUIN_166 [Arthrobacter phage Atuin]|nr:hypothetical protein SEA_ATUIN_265 [Arthrobacter phage Atuin]